MTTSVVRTLNKQEFMIQMSRVMEVWGERYYPKLRIERIYRMFQSQPLALLSEIIDRMMDVQRAPPMPGDFARVMDDVMRERREAAARSRPVTDDSIDVVDPKSEDGRLVKARLRLVIAYAAKRITKKQFDAEWSRLTK